MCLTWMFGSVPRFVKYGQAPRVSGRRAGKARDRDVLCEYVAGSGTPPAWVDAAALECDRICESRYLYGRCYGYGFVDAGDGGHHAYIPVTYLFRYGGVLYQGFVLYPVIGIFLHPDIYLTARVRREL